MGLSKGGLFQRRVTFNREVGSRGYIQMGHRAIGTAVLSGLHS